MQGAYRFCKTKHNPPESYGDCVKACIDTILNRDDTPHVFDNRDGEKAWSDLREWLNKLGLTAFITAYNGLWSKEEFFESISENNPDIVYMLFAQSGGEDHAVVCKGGEVVHNPAWIARSITGPHSIGEWIVIVLGKI